ncbi:hypothetical protein KR018_002505, partial [Drosophila ironensis]
TCPPPAQGQVLRCLHCKKVIGCSRFDTSGLALHIEKDHPEVFTIANDKIKNLHRLAANHGISEERLSEISKMTGMKDNSSRSSNKGRKSKDNVAFATDDEKDEPSCPAAPRPCPNCSVADNQPPDQKKRNLLMRYKISIKSWTPTDGYLFCPKCSCTRRPLLKISQGPDTGCCASYVVACWPLCFLPCLLTPDNKEYLHCANCNVFLGVYDRERNFVNPSRDFV